MSDLHWDRLGGCNIVGTVRLRSSCDGDNDGDGDDDGGDGDGEDTVAGLIMVLCRAGYAGYAPRCLCGWRAKVGGLVEAGLVRLVRVVGVTGGDGKTHDAAACLSPFFSSTVAWQSHWIGAWVVDIDWT